MRQCSPGIVQESQRRRRDGDRLLIIDGERYLALPQPRSYAQVRAIFGDLLAETEERHAIRASRIMSWIAEPDHERRAALIREDGSTTPEAVDTWRVTLARYRRPAPTKVQ